MDLGGLPGYRWVVANQYDERFRERRPGDLPAELLALAPYVERVVAALDLPDEGAHLDLGCGAGGVALSIARARPRMRVLGIDLSERALALARAAAAGQGAANAAFEARDAEDPPAGPFDRMTALSVFNLMPDKRAALAAWRRAAAPRARLVLSDAFATTGTGTTGAGAASLAALPGLAREAGWRVVHQESLAALVERLHARRAWPWPEYVRPGHRYLLLALEPA